MKRNERDDLIARGGGIGQQCCAKPVPWTLSFPRRVKAHGNGGGYGRGGYFRYYDCVIYNGLLSNSHINLTYMRTIVFIVVIAALVQFIEMVLKKYMPALYNALGVYLPLITTNCAVLGVAITNTDEGYGVLKSMWNGFGTAVGFTIAIIIMAGVRERTEHNEVPEVFKGSPMVLVTAGLMAIAFSGFAGIL